MDLGTLSGTLGNKFGSALSLEHARRSACTLGNLEVIGCGDVAMTFRSQFLQMHFGLEMYLNISCEIRSSIGDAIVFCQSVKNAFDNPLCKLSRWLWYNLCLCVMLLSLCSGGSSLGISMDDFAWRIGYDS
jgi:hypothetical protein